MFDNSPGFNALPVFSPDHFTTTISPESKSPTVNFGGSVCIVNKPLRFRN